MNEAEQYVNFIENYAIPKAMSTEEVRKANFKDDMLQKVIENLQKGCWNEHPRRIATEKMKTFKKIRSELTVTRGGLLLKGTKMLVPTKLQERVVELAHQGHDLRKSVVPGDRFTGRKESEEMHGLSSQHTSTRIIDGTIKHVKATRGTMATC